jgi:superfamily II DNA helicase RecQ
MTDIVSVKDEQVMLEAPANENSIQAPPMMPTQSQDSQPSPSTAIGPPSTPDIYTKAKAAGNFSAPALPKPKVLTTREAATAALRRHWGYSEFRPGQADIIDAVVSGRDCFVLMATGGGKSACYQIPALISGRGPVIVVSPLISLMEDQTRALAARGIRACFLGTGQTDPSVASRAFSGDYSLIYMSPERVESAFGSFQRMLDDPKLGITCFAIDESH